MHRNHMLLFIGLAFAASGAAYAGEAPDPSLLKQAKVSESHARDTALAKVKNGSVLSSELENERGKLVWSFDISKPGTKTITEIQVDAKSGKIVRTEHENPAKQKAEAAAEAAEKH